MKPARGRLAAKYCAAEHPIVKFVRNSCKEFPRSPIPSSQLIPKARAELLNHHKGEKVHDSSGIHHIRQ
jgi:hypothetical protein